MSHYDIARQLRDRQLSEWDLMEHCRRLCEPLCDGSRFLTNEEVSRIICRNTIWIEQTLAIYKLPQVVLDELKDGRLSRTVALYFVSYPENMERILVMVKNGQLPGNV